MKALGELKFEERILLAQNLCAMEWAWLDREKKREQGANQFYMRPAIDDPENSVSVFERGRVNELGEPFCVEAAITPEQGAKLCSHHNNGR